MNRKEQKSDKGLSIVSSIASIPLIFIGLIILVFIACELNKAYWDYRVSQMCDEDGGVEIFEFISLSAEEFSSLPRTGENGERIAIPVRHRGDFKEEDTIFAYMSINTLKSSFPKVTETTTSIYHNTNKPRLVAEVISYARVGSDFPIGLGPSSSFRCPPKEQNRSRIKQLFIVKE